MAAVVAATALPLLVVRAAVADAIGARPGGPPGQGPAELPRAEREAADSAAVMAPAA